MNIYYLHECLVLISMLVAGSKQLFVHSIFTRDLQNVINWKFEMLSYIHKGFTECNKLEI